MVSGRHAELWSDAIGANGSVVAYGHYGRPVARVPRRARQRVGVRATSGMVGARRRAARRRSHEALLRRLLRRRLVVERLDPARGPRARARALRVVDPRPGRAVDPRRLRRPAGDRHVGVSLGAYHAVNFALKRADLFPLALGLSGNYDPATWDAWGERGDGHLLQQPDRLRRAHGRRPPRLAARPPQRPARVRPGAVGGHAPARSRARKRLAGLLSEKGIRARAGPLGPRRPARLALLASPARPSSATVLLMDDDHAPDRDAARHRGGLADARSRRSSPGSARSPTRRATQAPPDDRADHDGAVRPARQGAPRPRRRPARLLVLPPARVAEEGRADGRRLPAQQPVHVPVDGEARGLLRDAAARAEGAADRARAAQEPARQRALRVHRGQVQPALRPRRDRRHRSATRCS